MLGIKSSDPNSSSCADIRTGTTTPLHDWSFATVTNPLFDLASWLHDASEPDAATYLDAYFCAWADALAPERMRDAWRVAKPLAAVVEMMKLIELADIVGPDHDFNWLPMTYGWGRRLLNAATDPDLTINGWRTSVRTRPRTSSASSAEAC
ncbi:hypothetical protein [Nonomuraea insulae]|uniref:Uncharacterized protein n=1 Tax=Nonomuraea insulae TaxID=1616787 RepID=A0ABW1CHN7_9ACTN